MGSILNVLNQQLSPDLVGSIAKTIGANKGATAAVVAAGVPLLIAALSRNASEPDGADALHQALTNDHDGSILNHLNDHVNDPQTANGAGILGHVLGNQEGEVEQGIAAQTGLDTNAVAQILTTLAPVVMGALGQTVQQEGLDSGGLANVLSNERQSVDQSAPDLIGLLGSLLGGGQPDQGGGGGGGGGGDIDIAGVLGALLGGKR